MRRFNLSEWALTNRALVLYAMIVLGIVDRPEFCRHSVAALRVAPFKLYR